MRKRKNFDRIHLDHQAGFTLIEILIVVILLGILATIIIPQVSISTDDAKLNSLKTSLNNIRGAVELYYYQHSNKYPGEVAVTGSGAPADAEAAAAAFKAQLTTYTSAAGATAVVKDSTYKYGPYLKEGLPTNPFNDSNDIVCEITVNDITARVPSGTNKGWKFYTKTGVLMPDDGSHNSL
jgi:prepilin-type N-terminal cleavage/methylation domain-containing protein